MLRFDCRHAEPQSIRSPRLHRYITLDKFSAVAYTPHQALHGPIVSIQPCAHLDTPFSWSLIGLMKIGLACHMSQRRSRENPIAKFPPWDNADQSLPPRPHRSHEHMCVFGPAIFVSSCVSPARTLHVDACGHMWTHSAQWRNQDLHTDLEHDIHQLMC